MAGVVATNTTLTRPTSVAAHPVSAQAGGLSGRPLTARAAEVVALVRDRAGDALAVIGSGGVMDVDDALALSDAGADLVQVYTGLVYGGPALVRRIAAEPRRGPARGPLGRRGRRERRGGRVRHFGLRLQEATDRLGTLCVGVDPHPPLLAEWGLPDDADGLARFADACVEAFAGQVAVVKPQSAFFERHGSRGVAVLERLLADLRGTGTLSLLDVKRGDIGSTMQAYADAYLRDDAPLAADAITVSPFLGAGSLAPALDLARATGRGVFVLALTSNAEGPGVQHAVPAGGGSVAGDVVATVAARNAGLDGVPARPGDVGLVVGATVGDAVQRLGLDLAASGAPLLAPGLGAQGATVDDLAGVFGAAAHLVLPTSSRDLLRHGPTPGPLREAGQALAARCSAALRHP
ncbi:hypothetical protein GCM10025868_03520 [Angustibacter aerolatus]|uniref:Orotidine 5'-phosphate decarboxylase n=1 Tax=Angustibacter aerolatus TaxID=1162965 RepID=A0ABQ6JBC9_9ACTN|nr:hypothetical protein GCM10025868_03520 [Angustibacter aerolatus]